MATVFLDLDGTLIDSGPGIIAAFGHALAEAGVAHPGEAALRACVGPPLRDGFRGLLGPGGDVEAAVTAYLAHYQAGAMFEATVYDGVPEMLAALAAAGHALHVATSKIEPDAAALVRHFGFRPPVGRVFGATRDGTRSEKPELLAHARAETGGGPAVMLGDRRFDVAGARANGMPAIAALWGYGGAEELAQADAAARHPGEVPALVARLLSAR